MHGTFLLQDYRLNQNTENPAKSIKNDASDSFFPS